MTLDVATPYAIFSGHAYCPSGGWADLRGRATTLGAAQGLVEQCRAYGFDWYQIVDVRCGKVVETGTLSDYATADHFLLVNDLEEDWLAFLERASGGPA